MTLILDPPGEPTIAEQIEHFYEAARYHTSRCECGICDGVDGLHRIALRLLKENEDMKAASGRTCRDGLVPDYPS